MGGARGEAWSEPVPLGDSLNSSGDEMFPTYHDGKLYFASNGHGGQGGLDMFYSEPKDGKWSAPKNLGDNINSTADDFGIVFNKNSTGFSPRTGKMEQDQTTFTSSERSNQLQWRVRKLRGNLNLK